jgi:hypothetical protein
MKIALTKLDKILIGISIFLYVFGYFIGGWSIIINLIFLFFIASLIKKSYDKGKLVTLYLIFFIVFIFLNILIKIGYFLNLFQNYSLKQTANKNKVIPTKAISYLKPPKTKDQIVWKTYNFTDKKTSFSLKIPDVGDFCNGCFDHAGMAENAQGQWITGSYYKDDYDKKWSFQVVVFYPYLKYQEGMAFDNLTGIFLDKLRLLKIGETLEDKGEYGSSIITRIEDVTIMGKTSKQFTISSTSHFVGDNEITKKVIVDFPSYSIIIDYSYIPPIYDVFDKILSSFSMKLYVKPDYGEPLGNIIALSPSPGWKRYIDDNGDYYLDFPDYFAWNKQGETKDILFEKNLVKELHGVDNYIEIIKEQSIQQTKEKIKKLKNMLVGEKKVVTIDSLDQQMDRFRTYERLPDVFINDKKMMIFLNNKPFEMPDGTSEYIYIYEGNIDYIVLGITNENKESLDYINFSEFNKIILTLHFL